MCGCVELGICTFLYEVLIMELIFPIISLIMWLGGTFLALWYNVITSTLGGHLD